VWRLTRFGAAQDVESQGVIGIGSYDKAIHPYEYFLTDKGVALGEWWCAMQFGTRPRRPNPPFSQAKLTQARCL
jgi:hypothetical protein